MEPVPQTTTQQQGRQPPVYDIRGGGHYGKSTGTKNIFEVSIRQLEASH